MSDYDHLLNFDIKAARQQKKAEEAFEKRVSNGKKGGRPVGRRKRVKSGNGYSYIFVKGKQVLEHRHLMTQHLGRDLLDHEAVYFIDGNKDNITIENLTLGIKPGKRTSVICPHCETDIFTH